VRRERNQKIISEDRFANKMSFERRDEMSNLQLQKQILVQYPLCRRPKRSLMSVFGRKYVEEPAALRREQDRTSNYSI
jgi:hypothetical protein